MTALALPTQFFDGVRDTRQKVTTPPGLLGTRQVAGRDHPSNLGRLTRNAIGLLAESGHVVDELVQLGFELLELILFGLQLLLGLRFRRLTLLRQICGRGEVRLRVIETRLNILPMFRVLA